MQTIKIAAIGSIHPNEDGTITLYLMADRNKDITHTIELDAYAARSFMQVAAQLLWLDQLKRQDTQSN